jgi:hypothetical protein
MELFIIFIFFIFALLNHLNFAKIIGLFGCWYPRFFLLDLHLIRFGRDDASSNQNYHERFFIGNLSHFLLLLYLVLLSFLNSICFDRVGRYALIDHLLLTLDLLGFYVMGTIRFI